MTSSTSRPSTVFTRSARLKSADPRFGSPPRTVLSPAWNYPAVNARALHVALDGRGLYSLTPVSDQRCDFEIVEVGPREFTPDSVISTLQVTNHGPADYVGEVRVQNQFRGRVTSVECPGLTNRWMEGGGAYDSWLELTLDGPFPAGETRSIRITRQRERRYNSLLPSVSTVTPSLPVELDQSNNTSIILTEPAARRGGGSHNRPQRPGR